jgi:hypothetical protein
VGVERQADVEVIRGLPEIPIAGSRDRVGCSGRRGAQVMVGRGAVRERQAYPRAIEPLDPAPLVNAEEDRRPRWLSVEANRVAYVPDVLGIAGEDEALLTAWDPGHLPGR